MESMADGLRSMQVLLTLLLWTAVFSVPLALWKLVDILVWVYHHLHWS